MVEGGVGLQETGPLGNFVHLQILYFKTAYLNLIYIDLKMLQNSKINSSVNRALFCVKY